MKDWLLKSSEDPTKVSLTVRGALESVAFIAVFAGVSQVDTQTFITQATMLVFGIASAVSALRSIFGLVRKVANTFISR